ncbi:MAG: hypothetical protein GY811_07430 [Myxococcales bacterium]|nr:hypothetical protein [Myxococcales bacterium]
MATRPMRRGTRANDWLLAGLVGLVGLWLLWPNSGQYETRESEVLARIIQSEIGSGTKKQQRHVAWTARNLARERKQSLAEMVCSPCGPQKRGRPMSSRQQPKDSHRVLAKAVLDAPQRRDPTGGASHFLNPRLQNHLARSGKRPGYRGNSYSKVRRRWIRTYGWQPYYRLGNNLEFWGPKKRKGKKRKGKKRKGKKRR